MIGALIGLSAQAAISLDYCADQYLLALAEPSQIVALSRAADDDYAYMRDASKGHRLTRATLEETLTLGAGLVFRQWGGAGTAARLEQYGATVVSLGFPEDFNGVEENVRLAAAALERRPEGEALISEMRGELAAIDKPSTSVRALYVTPGGVTAGAHTMIDAMMQAAGVINIAAEEGKNYWPALPAEALVKNPPDLIIAGFFDGADTRINHWSAARHPALRRLMKEIPTVYLSPDLVSCAGWQAAIAVEKIADAASRVRP